MLDSQTTHSLRHCIQCSGDTRSQRLIISKSKLIPCPTRVLAAAIALAGVVNALAGGFTGKVTETMNASSYTYVQVDTGTNKIWAAANRFPVKVGDVVTVPESEPMVNFHSPTLNREFPVIYFAGSIRVAGAKAEAGQLPEGHPVVSPKAKAAAVIDFTGIKPAKDGKTVEQIYASSAKLSGKSVKLRGKVVKYNGNILGKNWLHVQDGTGGPVTNDILVTTTAEAKVADTVLIEGKVALNKDFGSGYKYDLLIEDAQVAVE